MRNSPIVGPGLLVVALALSAGGGPALGAEEIPRRIPARVLEGRFLVVPVSVNGRGPYPFLLDTGSSASIVDERLARDLALPLLGPAVQETATSAREVALVRGTLTLGRATYAGPVIRGALHTVKEMDGGIRGVVGQDLLARGNWWLDYRGSRVVEDPDGALAGADLGERLPLQWPGGRPAIDVVLPSRRALRLVLDSAASAPVLFHDLPDAIAQPESVHLGTAGDAALVPIAAIGPLRAGRTVISRLGAAVLPETATPRTEDGLLPTALLEGIYLDHLGGAVVLDPRRAALSAVR